MKKDETETLRRIIIDCVDATLRDYDDAGVIDLRDLPEAGDLLPPTDCDLT